MSTLCCYKSPLSVVVFFSNVPGGGGGGGGRGEGKKLSVETGNKATH